MRWISESEMNIECSFGRVDNYICQLIYLKMNISKFVKSKIQSPHRTFSSECIRKQIFFFSSNRPRGISNGGRDSNRWHVQFWMHIARLYCGYNNETEIYATRLSNPAHPVPGVCHVEMFQTTRSVSESNSYSEETNSLCHKKNCWPWMTAISPLEMFSLIWSCKSSFQLFLEQQFRRLWSCRPLAVTRRSPR